MMLHSRSIIVSFLVLWRGINADIFYAMSSVESLMDTHKSFIASLESYIKKDEKRLDLLNENLLYYKKEHEMATKDVPNYLGNPINSYKLLKLLTDELQSVEKRVYMNTEYVKDKTVRYPTQEDLDGAIEALVRIQVVYQLNASQIADGMGDNSTPMLYDDCHYIGIALIDQGEYKKGIPWLLKALSLHLAEDHSQSAKHERVSRAIVVDMVELISYGFYMQDQRKTALEWTNWWAVLKGKDYHPRELRPFIKKHKKLLYEEELDSRRKSSKLVFLPKNGNHKENITLSERHNVYENLCRGDVELPGEVKKKLKCFYLSEGHPFLRLARVRTEQLYSRPDILMFHGVMTDAEMHHIKSMARTKLKRCDVGGMNTTHENKRPEHMRTCKVSNIKDSESDVIARVSVRVASLTGLTVATAEAMQVADYGIGGHFLPHYDFAENASAFEDGNRIATFLFYMSDVAEGGATVFNELGLTVLPVKGSAIFWYNLHSSGERTFSSHHSACPVLRGYKWIATKWLHEHGQELLKPCGLREPEDSYLRLTEPPSARPPQQFYEDDDDDIY